MKPDPNLKIGPTFGGQVRCQYFDSCPFQEQRRFLKDLEPLGELGNARVFVMAHSYLTVPSSVPDPDLVIVDESCWQGFIDITGQPNSTEDLTFHDFLEASDPALEHYKSYSDVIERIIKAMNTNTGAFLGPLSRMFHGWSGCDTKPRGTEESLSPIDIGHLELAIEHIRLVASKHTAPRINPKHSDASIKQQTQKWCVPKLRKIEELLGTLCYELRRKKSTSSISYNPENQKPIRVHSLKQNMINKPTPVLLIDASASHEINSKIWGHHLQHVEVKAERNAKVIQIRKRTFSKSSLGIPYNAKTAWQARPEQLQFRQEVINFINKVAAETKGKVFFAASKQIEEVFKPHLSDNIMTSHFSALRGRNEFEHCEVAIILGREEPSIQSVEDIALALLSRNRKSILRNTDYIRVSRNRRLVNGTVEPEQVTTHIDPFAQEILEQIRECEVEQAIDRMRLMHLEIPKTVYLLTSVVLDISVDRSVDWKNLIHASKIDKAMQELSTCGKVFPLGASELAHLFPHLWSSRDAVKGYINRRGGFKWVVSLIRYYISNDPLLLVEYRRLGQRGKPSRAIVSALVPDIRTILEKAFGPISKFTIVKELNEEINDDA